MINIDKGTEQLDKADNFLTKLKTLLKKHWGILLLLLVGILIYFIVTSEPSVDEGEVNYEEMPVYEEESLYEEEPMYEEGYDELPVYQEDPTYINEPLYDEGYDEEYYEEQY